MINSANAYQKYLEADAKNKVLKEHNRILTEALQGLINEITQPGYPLHSGMTIVWIDKGRDALKNNNK